VPLDGLSGMFCLQFSGKRSPPGSAKATLPEARLPRPGRRWSVNRPVAQLATNPAGRPPVTGNRPVQCSQRQRLMPPRSHQAERMV
jgi:hypothetical protein